MDAWLVALIGIQFSFVSFLIWIAVSYRQKNLQRRTEERLRIVERFDSGKDLSDFLETEQGRQFIELFAVRHRDPAGLIIAGVVVGILGLFAGAAFGILVAVTPDDFLIPAVLSLVGGLGVLAATGVSFRLARKFRLLHSQQDLSSELSESPL